MDATELSRIAALEMQARSLLPAFAPEVLREAGPAPSAVARPT